MHTHICTRACIHTQARMSHILSHPPEYTNHIHPTSAHAHLIIHPCTLPMHTLAYVRTFTRTSTHSRLPTLTPAHTHTYRHSVTPTPPCQYHGVLWTKILVQRTLTSDGALSPILVSPISNKVILIGFLDDNLLISTHTRSSTPIYTSTPLCTFTPPHTQTPTHFRSYPLTQAPSPTSPTCTFTPTLYIHARIPTLHAYTHARPHLYPPPITPPVHSPPTTPPLHSPPPVHSPPTTPPLHSPPLSVHPNPHPPCTFTPPVPPHPHPAAKSGDVNAGDVATISFNEPGDAELAAEKLAGVDYRGGILMG